VTTLNPQRLAQRAQGRKEAAALTSLILDTAAGLPESEANDAFWDSLRDLIDDKYPRIKPGSFNSMTDAEVREFRSRTMVFGKYNGQPIMDVPLGYLDWLIGENDSFRRDIGRYLRNEKVTEQLRTELEQERPGT
jgi:uncharacterized protein (DUF3820 family)